ncbi:alpha/beta fold hydrolase [Streptomyces sp. NBC_01795]|uniref:thioesterase II family protein n=1 Tax=Streptomyces sp. NBC_01795 TaxID=2975943 RepID=UPI002DD9C9B7|nr:alpha/beta fold hydrolase [Streptomyces sp. NBC_01795]WSA90896.1 alpha/beta fold hydrolase [Streptomyces sp. NBC_01795]
MSTATPQSRTPWIPFPPPDSGGRAGVRLLCFPCAGQGASVYRPWQRLLAPEIDVVPIQLPGREGRATTAPYRDMDSLMEALFPVLWEQARAAPGGYALFGHSLGAAVAFEGARRLEAAGLPARGLTVAAQRPPHVPSGRRPLHDLPRAAFMTMLGLYGQVPVELFDDPAAVELAAAALRADFTLVETYAPAPEPLLGCPVTALAGLADTSIPPVSVRGWRELTSGPFTFRPLPGGHFFVNERTEEIVGLLRSALG